jgi:hypothetical protein
MRRPDQEAVLEITGESRIAATYRADLKPAEDQGDDPSQLVLDLIITNPSGSSPMGGMETRGSLFISYKEVTDKEYSTVKIVDVNAAPDTTEETVWVLPVKQVDWGTTATAAESRRWKGKATTSHRQH